MPSDRTEAKKNWLNQHDSLQEELMMLKKELVKTKEDVLTNLRQDTATATTTAGIDRTGSPRDQQPMEEPIRAVEVPDDVEAPSEAVRPVPEPTIAPAQETPPPKERSIRDLIGPPSTENREPADDGSSGSHALPKHPELTSYIAKVMQHENKLKRKKFERDKTTKPPRADVQPPSKKEEGGTPTPEAPGISPEEGSPAPDGPTPTIPPVETTPDPSQSAYQPGPDVPDTSQSPIETPPQDIGPRQEAVAFDPASFTPKETEWHPQTLRNSIKVKARAGSRRAEPEETKGGLMNRIKRLWKRR